MSLLSNGNKKRQDSLMELERAREDIEDLEKYIEELRAFLPLAVCTLSSIGVIIDVNLAFTRLTGFKLTEAAGRDIEDFFTEKKVIAKIIKEAEKKGVGEKELTFLTKNKGEIPVSVSVGARKDKEGRLIGFFVSLTDIGQLKDLQKGLEEKVKKRTKELQEKIDQLEKFQKLTVGRELKMVELKKEIKKLKQELKKLKEEKTKL